MKRKFLGILILAVLFSGCQNTDTASEPKIYNEQTSAVIFEDPPEDVRIPEFYFGHDFPWFPFRIYMYTNHQGKVQYRAYGRGDAGAGFYNVDFLINEDSQLEILEEERQLYTAMMEEPGLGRIAPVPKEVTVPRGWRRMNASQPLWEIPYSNGRSLYRVWAEFPDGNGGRQGNFYPATEDGRMLLGGVPDILEIEEYQVVIKRTGIPKNLHRSSETMSMTEITEQMKAEENLEARLLEKRLEEEKNLREEQELQAQEEPEDKTYNTWQPSYNGYTDNSYDYNNDYNDDYNSDYNDNNDDDSNRYPYWGEDDPYGFDSEF